jgi:hypothetical protein
MIDSTFVGSCSPSHGQIVAASKEQATAGKTIITDNRGTEDGRGTRAAVVATQRAVNRCRYCPRWPVQRWRALRSCLTYQRCEEIVAIDKVGRGAGRRVDVQVTHLTSSV